MSNTPNASPGSVVLIGRSLLSRCAVATLEGWVALARTAPWDQLDFDKTWSQRGVKLYRQALSIDHMAFKMLVIVNVCTSTNQCLLLGSLIVSTEIRNIVHLMWLKCLTCALTLRL